MTIKSRTIKKSFLLFITLNVLQNLLWSQGPDELLQRWSSRSPVEKVYLHVDRDNYIAGETTWFKAYLYANYQPDTITSNLYVELTNDAGVVFRRSVLPVFFGGTNGQFELPDSLPTGSYFLRAYSPSMLNSAPDFIGRRSIYVYGKNNTTALTKAANKTTLVFFPEGGNLISNASNTLAFKATDENGWPVSVNGKLFNHKDEAIGSFETYHDGMGMFELTPDVNEKYYAILDADKTGTKYLLPDQTKNGIALTVIPHPQGSFFELKQRKDDPAFTAAYILGQMQHRVVFRNELNKGKEEIQGVINTLHLNSGILQITFFNAADQPLAERLVFVNNKEYVLKANLLADTLNFGERSRNRFSIRFQDSVQGNFSVSVSDAAYDLSPSRNENIFTGLLLTSDIKGYVNDPAWYFSRDDDSVKTAMDLVMMTNGWRRFKWTELSKALLQPLSLKNPAYITLAGKVTIQGIKKPFADKQLLVMISGANKKRSTHLIQTDANGKFFLDSLVFFEKNRLLFADVRGKKSQYIDVYLDTDTLHRKFSVPASMNTMIPGAIRNDQPIWQMDYDAILKANGLMMEGVTVKAKRKTAMEEVDDRYTTGLFSGDAVRAIDLVNNDEANPYRNIFDYLQSKVPGMMIFQDGFDYNIFYRQGASVSSMGNIPMTLFLDEVPTDASYIAAIPANQVALVKVYSSFAAADGNAPGGVLAIYTKKGKDYVNTSGFANHTAYNGYSVIREFYAPDYSSNKQNGSVDNRITLDWRPAILVNAIAPTIPFSFYNNDRTKTFRVVIEGMTQDGKLLMIEKIFPNKPF